MSGPIRAAVVGGRRGGSYGRAFDALKDQIVLTAICDIDPDVLATWRIDRPDVQTFSRLEDLLDADACDAVFLATPMNLHARQAIQALGAGKHVLSEVIAASTLDDCWALIEAVEASNRVYMLAENYCYTRPTMMIRNMVDRGIFGNTTYAEGAYIHDCRPLMFDARNALTWRGEFGRHAPGNGYPTHSLGPVAQWLCCAGPSATDRLIDVVTFTTPDNARRQYVVDRFGDHHPAGAPGFFRHGDSASTLLRTERGSVAYLRVDSASPRPHNMTHYVLQGTRAAYLSSRHAKEDPLVWIQGRHADETIGKEEWESLWDYAGELEHPRWKERGDVARGAGHGGGDYFVVEDFVIAVANGTPPPIDVYDAVTWSSVFPLSVDSVRQGGKPQVIPKFRRQSPALPLPRSPLLE
jgi:predicted dehydrogenase